MKKKRNSEQIAKENDLFRTTMIETPRHRIVMTQGVALSKDLDAVANAVRSLKIFEEGNDSYEEHDFGKVIVNDEKYFWKIEYFDANFEYGSDPYNDETVCRVLTIMRADEY